MPPPYQRVGLLLGLIACLVPAPASAGDFELDSHSCSGSASGNANQGSNWLDGVAFSGSYTIPAEATSITLQSSIPKKTSPGDASAQIQNCTMTYNFTWHPASGQTLQTDPPPTTAIVKLSIGYNAGYWVATDGNGSVTGGVALTASGQVNGQGFSTVNNPVNAGNSQNATGLYATVSWSTGSGGATSYDNLTPVPAGGAIQVTVPITASTSASLTGDKCNSTDSATVTVTPTVSVTPVVLTLAETTGYTDQDGSHTLNILVGQGCMGSASAGSYALSNYSWTVPGNIFKAFTAGDAGDTVTPVTAQDLQMASPTWLWYVGDPDNGLLATVSASFAVADGATQLGQCTAQADVKVWAPTTTQGNVTPGQAWWLPGAPPLIQAGNGFDAPGMLWNCSAKPQDLFSCAGAGSVQFVQFATPERHAWTPLGQGYHISMNGQTGLDTHYPYPFTRPGTPYPDDGSTVTFVDYPSIGTSTDFLSYQVENEQFAAYELYMPADKGEGHQWVPLRSLAWGWSTPLVTRGGPDWTPPGGAADYLCDVPAVTDADATQFPIWSFVSTNGTFVPD